VTEDTAPDPQRVMRLARQAMSSAEYRRKFHMADFWSPKEFYQAQMQFFAEGVARHQRLIRGGNQVGKSFCCAYELATHLTGQYPKWWVGRRFEKPIRCWIVGPERTLVRDGPQKQLTSKGGEFGSGTIPLAAFAGKPTMVPGGTGSIDTIQVHHHSNGARDGISTATFKSFEQGAEKMQSESVDVIWVDERCSEEIYSELVARTTATDGIILLSYTPLKGGGELTYRFLNEYSPDRADIRIDVSEVRHISPERRAQLEENDLPHEREARIHGRPVLGIARVFPFPLEPMLRPLNMDTDIRPWAKYIVGLDFGMGHPAAAVLCAWVYDIDEWFVLDGFRITDADAFTIVRRIAGMCRGHKIPIAFPHDGHVRERGSGEAIADVYRRLGAPMLHSHAVNPDGSYAVEPALLAMIDHMKRGAFVVANHMSEWQEEFLSYHRNEKWEIVRQRDDLMSATRYAHMMRKYGRQLDECDEYNKAPGVHAAERYDPRPKWLMNPKREQTMAQGVDFDLFTGR
jgi:phage terminase large subunit-like protein